MAEATNTFTGGMNMDIPDMQMPGTAYTSALNATLNTIDGNEGILLNDMGNSKIYYKDDDGNNLEVILTPGYIPIGVKEFNGIIYIVSLGYLNIPNVGILIRGEIGSFPSPDYTQETGKLLNKYLPLHNAYMTTELSLMAFNSSFFNFDLEHPVNIEIQDSYDGSINLLLTDNKNRPRLINTAFAVQEGGSYTITKHIGNTNTNVYNISTLTNFNLETALQKLSYLLPLINFLGLETGGLLLVGGYVLYFKASDEDGNTTDIIAESGVIPVFLGTDGVAKSMNGGYANMRTDKSIHVKIENVDTSYSHVLVFYSRVTSGINESSSTTCHQLSDLYPLLDGLAEIIITGYEQTLDVDATELNTLYFIVDKNRAATVHLNITFVGNVKGSEANYEKLRNLSLHIYPSLVETDFQTLTGTNIIDPDDYSGKGYYSTKNIYNYTGYHNEEIYRFGVVYIYSDGSHSDVFNTFGINTLVQGDSGMDLAIKNKLKDATSEITYNEAATDYISNVGQILVFQENGYYKYNRRGVCRIKASTWNPWIINGVRFTIPEEVKEALKELEIIGCFYVRQKRIPLRLMQAFVNPIYENTYTPAIKWGAKISGNIFNTTKGLSVNRSGAGSFSVDSRDTYIFETFFNACYDVPFDKFTINDSSKESKGVFAIKSLSQSPSNNMCNNKYNQKTGDPADIRYKLYLDYDKRIIVTLDLGLVYSKHSNETPDAGTKTTVYAVNGDNPSWDGKYNDATDRATVVCLDLLLRGAYALYAPEYELDQAYYNAFLTGLEFSIKIIKEPTILKRSSISERVYYDSKVKYKTSDDAEYIEGVKLIAIEDGVSLMGIQRNNTDKSSAINTATWKYKDTVYFSTKVGDATSKTVLKEVGNDRVLTFSPPITTISSIYLYDTETNTNLNTEKIGVGDSGDSTSDGGRRETYTIKDINGDKTYKFLPYNEPYYPTNLLRGLYSPFIGMYTPESLKISRENIENSIINIYIPGYKEANIPSYRKVCFQDGTTYYTISNQVSFLQDGLISTVCYRGDCYASVGTHRINRNFLDSTAPANDTIVSENGFMHDGEGNLQNDYGRYYTKDNELRVDPWVTAGLESKKDSDKPSANGTNLGDMNAVLMGSWVTFPLATTMNIALRSDDRSYPTEKLLMGQYRSFYPLYGVNISGSGKLPDSTVYNKGFSISGGVRTYALNDTETYENTYYKNRIYYSNISDANGVIGGSVNGNRTILEKHHADYETKYGSIVKLIGLGSYLLCIMEHGVGAILVKPRALIDESTTGNTFISTNKVIDDRLTNILSDTFGTTWETSVIETPYGTYGIDTYAKKIWTITGGLFSIISDYNISSFLNDNLNIINDKIDIGNIKIKSHYNQGKGDVIFTCYLYKEEDNDNVLWSICWNEIAKKWTTFYSWIPEESANIGSNFITFNHFDVKQLIDNQDYQLSINMWKHGPANFIANTDTILPTTWYGETLPFEIEFVVALSLDNHKLFTNLELISNKAAPESFHYLIVGQCYENTIDKPTQYYRLERAKELWHRSGSDITFDSHYKDFNIKQRPLWHYKDNQLYISNENIYVKSLVPWSYYVKYHNPNKIENYYKLATANTKDYTYLVGTELVKDKRLQELCIQTHALGADIDGPAGVLRGNMKYMEDKWYVLINPVQYKEKNEALWIYPPIVFNNSPVPSDIDENKLNEASQEMNLTSKDFDFTDWGNRKSLKLKDKYIKIRIRYSGKDKVILQAIKTLYQVSYT